MSTKKKKYFKTLNFTRGTISIIIIFIICLATYSSNQMLKLFQLKVNKTISIEVMFNKNNEKKCVNKLLFYNIVPIAQYNSK